MSMGSTRSINSGLSLSTVYRLNAVEPIDINKRLGYKPGISVLVKNSRLRNRVLNFYSISFLKIVKLCFYVFRDLARKFVSGSPPFFITVMYWKNDFRVYFF